MGLRGADWWLKTFRQLPGYYITEDEATKLGWIPILANLASIAPGKMLTKGVYKNRDKRLPDALGRIWYEADIHYSFGDRGGERILYSNDGSIFVTYDLTPHLSRLFDRKELCYESQRIYAHYSRPRFTAPEQLQGLGHHYISVSARHLDFPTITGKTGMPCGIA